VAARVGVVRQDFSLVLGGPLFQLFRRTHLSDATLGLAWRRVAFAVLITWLPLVLLAAGDGALVGPGRAVPLAQDIGLHLRFLVVAPLLMLSEPIVHHRLRPLIEQFRTRNLVRSADVGRFTDAVDAALRLRNSVWAELVLLAIVFVVGGAFTVRRYQMLGAGTWYDGAAGGAGLSPAGLWLVFVSLPLLQFLMLRWYFRLGIWALFLRRVAALDLDLQATHPDKAGGLVFLGDSLIAFAPLAVAHGVLFAGMIADRIFFAHAKLPDFEVEIAAGAILLVLVFAGPLLVFAPRLARTKRAGLLQYGALGQRYVRDFRQKWMAANDPPDEPLVGTGDIQSLADLGNSFGTAEQMRFAPIRPTTMIWFLAGYLAPMVPLALTMMSPQKLIEQLVGVLF
jgi:hypothetical protein